MTTKRHPRMEDILRGRNLALQELARGAPLLGVLLTLARNAEKVFPDLRCSVLLLDEEKRRLGGGVAPSLPDSYVRAIDGVEIGPMVGSCGAAAFLGHRVIVEDIDTHPNWAPFRDLAAQAKLRASWSEPIVATDGEILGTFAMYYAEVRAPEEEELNFIRTTAQVAGIAIERSRSDLRHRESERRFRAVFNQRTELAGFVTREGIVADANDRSLQMIGAKSSEIIGRPFWETPWWAHDAALQEKLRAAIQRAAVGELVRFEAQHPRTDNVMAIIDFSLTPIRDESGEVELLLAEGVDVTEQRQVERELRESQLRAHEAEKLASIATLTAGIAHDIGAPMTAILGYAEMMMKSVADEDNRRRAGVIVEQVSRVTELVQALLSMARPGARPHQPLQLRDVVESSLTFYQERFDQLGIRVERDFAQVPAIMGDTDRLQQALLNLLVNAADAMCDGGTVRVSLFEPASGGVGLRIADSGAGIPEDQVGEIFEPFFTTKERGHGTGLGLLVAKAVLEEHHGTISVESAVDQGTTFTIWLPGAGS